MKNYNGFHTCREVYIMKKGRGYGEFSYRSRSFKKALGLLCMAAVLIPALTMTVQAQETVPSAETVPGAETVPASEAAAVFETAPVQTDEGWRSDLQKAEPEALPEALDLGFFIPQVSVFYGQQLKAAALTGTATDEQGQTVNGTFSWLAPETVMDQLGIVTADTVFTPSSAAFEKQNLTVHVKVEPAPSEIVEMPWTATPLKEGLLLKEIRLEGGMAAVGYPAPRGKKKEKREPVSGSFSWAEPEYALKEGKQEVKVIFTPDQKEYCSAEAFLTLETVQEQKPEKPQMPELYLSCPDIFYGETVRAEAWADGEVQPFVTYRYKGRGRTVYEESQIAPTDPGEYTVYASIQESELFEPVDLEEDFTIKRAVPGMQISADRTEVTGGGRVNLKMSVRNPYDGSLKKGLPKASGLRLAFEGKTAVRIEQEIEGSDGAYTAAFSVPDKDGTVTCRVYLAGNGFYEGSEATVKIQLRNKENSSGGNKEEGAGKDDGNHESSKKEEEQEPVIKTPEEVEADFWQDVIFRIYKAQEKGETVTINATGHGQMPDKVMEALRGHQKVTLALVWEGDMILIPAGKAPAAKKGNAAWTLMELSKSYPAPKPAQKPSGNQNKPPQKQPVVNQPSKPAAGQGQTGSAGSQFSSNKVSGSSGSHPAAVPESQETERTEPAETTEEAESTEAESREPEETIQETETEPEEPSAAEKKADWLTVAACVCAGAGLVAVLAAIATLVLKKKGEL